MPRDRNVTNFRHSPAWHQRQYPGMGTQALALGRVPGFGADAPELAEEIAQPVPFSQPAAVPVREEMRYGRTTEIPFTVGVASQRILLAPQSNTRRTFLFVVNTSALNQIFVGFGNVPSALSVPLNPGGGSIGFDAAVPQDDIWVLGAGVGSVGVLLYINKGVNDYPTTAGGG